MLPKCSQYINTYNQNSDKIEQINKAIDKVPNDKSVFTSYMIMPHIYKNLECYDIGVGDPATNQKYGTPEYTDYLVVDPNADQTAQQRFNTLIGSGRYELVYEGKSKGSSEAAVKVYKLAK